MLDDLLIDTLAGASRGRLIFDPTADRLVHRRATGSEIPVYATAAEVRRLMALLVLLDEGPLAAGEALERGVVLLLAHLDQHPLRALLGWQHLRAAATDPDIRGTADEDQLWGNSA